MSTLTPMNTNPPALLVVPRNPMSPGAVDRLRRELASATPSGSITVLNDPMSVCYWDGKEWVPFPEADAAAKASLWTDALHAKGAT